MSEIQWNAIVPAKRLNNAKSRLGRNDLTLPFLTDVLTALGQSKLIESITVVSADPTICEVAREMNFQFYMEDENSGLLPAINQGIDNLNPLQQENILIVLGDVPCLTPVHVDTFLTLGARHRSSFVPDAEGIGTTMWMRTNCLSATPHFGPRSRAFHRESGAIEVLDDQLYGARRDVDTAVDLWDAERIGLGFATKNALAKKPVQAILPDEIVVTIASVLPMIGVDESGHSHRLDDKDHRLLINPQVGQRIVIRPTT